MDTEKDTSLYVSLFLNLSSSNSISMEESMLTGAGDREVMVNITHNPNVVRFESPNSQYEGEVTGFSIENSSILTGIGGDEEHNTNDGSPIRLHDYSDPKDSAYLLRVYPTFLGLLAGKCIWEKHTPIPSTNPLMIISVILYAMAYLNLVIWSCMYDRHQRFSPGQCMITKYVFYILCLLAPFSLLPVLFIPLD